MWGWSLFCLSPDNRYVKEPQECFYHGVGDICMLIFAVD